VLDDGPEAPGRRVAGRDDQRLVREVGAAPAGALDRLARLQLEHLDDSVAVASGGQKRPRIQGIDAPPARS